MKSTMVLIALLTVPIGAIVQEASANPIRKIVTLLQDMSKEVEAEGAKEKELFDKFMCFCNGNNGAMTKKVSDLKSAIETYSSKVESEKAEKAQLEQEIPVHKEEFAGAQDDLAKALMMRNKENAEYEETSADLKTNIAALAGAIPSLEKGMGGSAFVQMPGVNIKAIRAMFSAQSDHVNSYDRSQVMSFLDQKENDPGSGQIVGIMKAMKDDMEKSLSEAEASEADAVKGYGELKAAKDTEAAASKKAAQTKSKRAGELELTIVQNADGLDDSTKELADTEKFLATLDAQCVEKQKEWATRSKIRAEEVEAISQAISILNDDDALDVFKKAAPSVLVQTNNNFGFLQGRHDRASLLEKARIRITAAAQIYSSKRLSLLAFSLNSKIKLAQKANSKADFTEITKMIDDMVTVLTAQQADDEKHKSFCEAEIAKNEDEKAKTTEDIASLGATISEITDEIATLAEDIATLNAGVNELDKSAAEATEQRKEEHAAYTESLALTETAIALIAKAKNRLQKFYNPTLYKAPPKVERSMEEKIIAGGAFVQKFQQPEAPETFDSSYEKKTEKSGGVMALMDMMVKEMESDAKEAQYAEKTASKEYAELMADSQATRAQDTKSVVEKTTSKATLEGKLVEAKEKKSLTFEELEEIMSYIHELHSSCDFIMENFDMRKEARTNEVESLKNAKAVLAGAVY